MNLIGAAVVEPVVYYYLHQSSIYLGVFTTYTLFSASPNFQHLHLQIVSYGWATKGEPWSFLFVWRSGT